MTHRHAPSRKKDMDEVITLRDQSGRIQTTTRRMVEGLAFGRMYKISRRKATFGLAVDEVAVAREADAIDEYNALMGRLRNP